MTKSQSVTEIATLDSKNMSSVVKFIEQKMKEFKAIEETPWKTGGILDGFGNIQTEMLVPNLIRALSMVRAKEREYNEAAESLGLTSYPAFSISGGNTESWSHDIKLRISILNQKETLDKLNRFKETMSKFISEEEQKAMAMEEFKKFFSENSFS